MRRGATLICSSIGLVALLAGCGSDSTNDDASAADTAPDAVTTAPDASDTAPAAASTAPPAATASPVVTEAAPATTEAGPATGEPIKVGFMNLEEGPVTFPAVGYGAQAAVDWTNQRGGVDGRPIELVRCSTNLTPEASAACASSFVDAGVVLAVEGVDLTDDGVYPILDGAGIPMLVLQPLTPTATQEAYALSDPYDAATGFVSMAKVAGASSMVAVFADIPSAKDLISRMEEWGSEIGVEVSSVLFPPTSTDWAPIAAQVIGSGAEFAYLASDEVNVPLIIQALNDAGYSGIVHAGATRSWTSTLPADVTTGVMLSSSTYDFDNIDAMPEEAQADARAFVDGVTAAGGPESVTALAASGWQQLRFVATLLGDIDGDITPAAVKAALDTDTDRPLSMSPATINCVANATAETPYACGRGALLYQFDGTALQPLNDGELITGSSAG